MLEKITLLFFMALSCYGAGANDVNIANALPLEGRFKVGSIQERMVSGRAQKLIGHMTLARQAIDYRLKTSAIDHLQTARAEASALLKEIGQSTQELTAVPFGKVEYNIGPSEKSYYVPVLVSEELVEEFADYSRGQGKKMEVKEVSIIQSTVRFNMKNTLENLTRSQEELLRNDYDQAAKSIEKIMEEAIVSENKVLDPVLMVWSNLILAREFMGRKQYKSARFTLKKTLQALSDIEKKGVLKKDGQDAKVLHGEVHLLSRELDQISPPLLLRAKNLTKQWAAKVKRWI